MYATFDRYSPVKLDSKINCLSWKGDVKHGWLALGNSANTVGITYTESNEDVELPVTNTDQQPTDMSLEKQGMRRNFNFREHTHEVTIVRWNPLLDKIATCDSSGTVIVWRNHNGRSIMELVNNRGSQISDFQWSRDGSKVLITYSDGYVLLGTAFGRRIWARQLNIGTFVTTPANHSQNSSRLLSSTWSPDDSRIVVGSSIGELIELDAYHNGSLVSTTEVLPGIGIIGLEWVRIPSTDDSASEETKPLSVNGILQDKDTKSSSNVRLSLYLRNGKVVLMNSCGDQQATIIRTGLIDGKMVWSSDGSVLAVAGLRKSQGVSTVRFFQPSGQLLFTLPLGTKDPITAVTWGHTDSKLFVAASQQLFTVTVVKGIPSLQALCQRTITGTLQHKDKSFELVLPTRLKVGLAESFTSVIKGHVPEESLLEYVSRPPPPSHRVYCTLIPSSVSPANSLSSAASSSSNVQTQRNRHPLKYTLYVEHMGNLIPVLEATRRSSKLRPSFCISLPSDGTSSDNVPHTPRLQGIETTADESSLDQSDAQRDTPVRCVDDDNTETHTSINTESGIQLAYKEDDTSGNDITKQTCLPSSSTTDGGSHSNATSSVTSSRHVAEVSSHLINSKFRIQSVSNKLPSDMGTVTIKTSFLHIQPRKVVVHLPPQEQTDSGVDSDISGDDGSSDESDVFTDSDLLLDSLSSMEELAADNVRQQGFESSSTSVLKTPTYHKSNKSTAGSQQPLPPPTSSATSNENSLIIHSKTPTWNEQHMIYQLDFGGRVTTKSAKNFQLEMGNEQVLQFGRIENGSFILDFQKPFSPIQAFATALANLV